MLKIYTYGEFLNNNPFIDVPESLGDVYFEDISIHNLMLIVWENRHTRFYANVYDSSGKCLGKFDYDVDYGSAKIKALKFLYPDGKYWEIQFERGARPIAVKRGINNETYLTDEMSD